MTARAGRARARRRAARRWRPIDMRAQPPRSARDPPQACPARDAPARVVRGEGTRAGARARTGRPRSPRSGDGARRRGCQHAPRAAQGRVAVAGGAARWEAASQ
eukprot:scaffold87640_cov35-Tisochrysis_lutea.AAC.2